MAFLPKYTYEVIHDEIGFKHNIEGPAWILYKEDGTVISERYYIHGRVLTKELWEKQPEVVAALVRKNVGVICQ